MAASRSRPHAPGPAPSVLRGMAFMLASTLAFSAMNAAVRYLSAELHPFEIAFWRSLFGVLAFLPVFVRHGWAPLRTQRIGLQALRGVLNVVSMLSFFLALSLSPFAKVAALSFTSPLFGAVLAVVLLGERIRARRITALVIGFVGTVVVFRPGLGPLDIGGLIVVGSSLASAFGWMVVKSLARTESSTAIAIYAMAFTTPFAGLAAIPFWQGPTSAQLLWLAAIGAIGGIGHLTFAQAMKEAEVTAVLPLDFTKLIWAALIGYAAFAEIPDAWTWMGGVLIFAAITYIAYRERQTKAARPGPAAGVTDR